MARQRLRSVFMTLAAICALGISQAWADGRELTRAFSGVWDQPDQQSQGFVVQISESEADGKIGVVYWFTYDEDLTPAWYLGVGPVVDNEIQMLLYKSTGIAFLQTGVEGNPNLEEIGTLILRFSNCNQGQAIFDTPEDELGSDTLRIKRLTSLYQMRCSGGISDDTPGDARPLQLELKLLPPGQTEDDDDGEGKAKFWERPGRSDLKVTVEDLVDGLHTLEVCAVPVGDFEVSDGEGDIQFRSPAIPGKALLDFDPRDCPFDIYADGVLVLTSGDAVLGPRSKDDDDDDDDDDGDDQEIEIEVRLDNTGVLPGARGSAEWEQDDDRTEFTVEVKDLPEGDYPLHVGGVEVGIIEVVRKGNQNRGELSFGNPPEAGESTAGFRAAWRNGRGLR